MKNFGKQEGVVMKVEISKKIMEAAKTAAKEMLSSKEIIRNLDFPGVAVSTDPGLVRGLDYFQEGGKTFYVGKKQELTQEG